MLDYAAFPDQRQDLIRQRLQTQGRVVCAELAVELQVSEHTIRRDLQELSKAGICKKVYGGAVLQLATAGSFTERKEQDRAKKSLLAQRCVQLLKPGTCVFIDTGTTNLELAKALPPALNLTVVTNSPEIAVAASKYPHCDVIMLGGLVQRSTGGCVSGPAISQLNGIIFDQAFIGGCAMSPEMGLTGFDYADCEFKKAVIAQSNQVVVALTANKIPGVARYIVAASQQIDVLVVETDLSKALHQAFRAENIEILTV
ncbi:DeoR/GlpR family DNA-binding transcription regulator [Kosakonia sp. SOY2]|uniref:DeoR/GlpR family DNA-binding transcription regulator n=1 Tax=Kosakonia TaxID=1330547 RepID=UPI0022AC1EB5|nr:DeoR/GlpR family DNA-binding transcription regulator [Kosakonia sp. SOY2]MCZ3380861.1 DeoR/GlpR family DNA-binding transcription regulator [Kosakonia sp. SOY2]